VKKVGLSSSEIGMTGLRFDPAKMQTPEEQVLFSKHQFAYNYARDIAKEMGAGSVLDYGCGDGYGADFLAEMLPGLKITATDIDKTALAGARIKYKRKNLQFVEMIDVKTYDLIVSYQVIEHVENVEEYLRDLRGMLKKDGKIIISTPDRVYRLTENQAPWNSFHLREYTREALEQDVQKVFPLGRVLRLTGEDNMLRIEYNRVAGNRADGAIYGGKLPKKTNRVYKPEDFYLTESDDKGSLDLFAVIENEFKGSKDYWEQRYVEGGNSGAGSYGNLAEFKAKIINKFVKKNKVSTVIELGVGDGNQLLLSEYPNFIGFDVSKTAVKMCREMFKSDKSKEFYTLDKLKGHTAELTLSLDVLYHLVEKDVFEQHIRSLFEASTRYVIIYAFDGQEFHTASHVQSRRFTDFIENNIKSWKLTKRIKNKYPHDDNNPDHTSRADFYIYERTA
jgi:cyclopropane fatty-acyl-phospholipid synthase-like methyltransferase